jgi:hypothetical protein
MGFAMRKSCVFILFVLCVFVAFSCSKSDKKEDVVDEENIDTDHEVEEEDKSEPIPDDEEIDDEDTDDDSIDIDTPEPDDEDIDEDIDEDSTGRVIVVSPDGDDSGDGSSDKPVGTISKALELAQPGDEVHVPAGNYNEALVITTDNIKLKGGFNADFERNSDHYENPDVYGADEENMTKITSSAESVIVFDGDLKNVTIEGFVIESTRDTGHSSAAVTVKSGSPVISYCTLIAGNPKGALMGALSGSLSAGLGIGGGNPKIHNNKIIGGEAVDNFTQIGTPTAVSIGILIGEISALGSTSSVSAEIYRNFITAGHSKDMGTDGGNVGIGIYRNNGDIKIHGNVITAGENKYKARSYGVLLSKNEGVVIYNNVVHGGTSTDLTAAVYFYDSTTAEVYNNTLDCGESTMTTTAIKLSGKYASPEIRNNLLFCVKDHNPVYEFNTNQTIPFAPVFENNVIIGGSTGVTIMGTQNSSDALYRSVTNIYLPAKTVADIGFVSYMEGKFEENDFRLTEESKDVDGNDITEAGDDLSEIFATDKDGNTRTVPWSVGAYELD